MKKSLWKANGLDMGYETFKFEDQLSKVTITKDCPSGFISLLDKYKNIVADVIDKREGQVNISKEQRRNKIR
jgi:hypothetical protein